MKGRHMTVNLGPEPLKLSLIFSKLRNCNTSLAHCLKEGGKDCFQLIKIKHFAIKEVKAIQSNSLFEKVFFFSHTIPKMAVIGFAQTSLLNILV